MDYEEPKFFEVMQYAAESGDDVIDMVSGNPDFEPPPRLRSALAEYAEQNQASFQYSPSDGLEELRLAIADRRDVAADRIVITNGVCEANYLAMAGALDRDAGRDVILLDPVYPYYPGKVTMLGGRQRLVATRPDGGIDVPAIAEVMSRDTALVVLNTPNNPSGAVYSPDAVREVVELAEAHDALVLADEVYERFDYLGGFESALAIDSAHVIVTNGFSKSMAITGFRVGYGIFPTRFADGARTRHMLVNIAASRPAQYAVLEALTDTPTSYYREARDLLNDRIDAFVDALDRAGAEYTTPAGGFYVLARFEGFAGTMENVRRLIDEAGVAGMPGATFGSSREDWIRFAVVTPRAVEAADRLGDYFG